MGGRGKSSGAVKRPPATSAPLNFADPGAIPLERLEAADERRRVTTTDVADGVEKAIEQMLAAPPDLYAKHRAGLERTLAQVAQKLKTRPVDEREAFSEALGPLLGRLRDQAEWRSS